METQHLSNCPTEPPDDPPTIASHTEPSDTFSETVLQINAAEIGFKKYASGRNLLHSLDDTRRKFSTLQTDVSSIQTIQSPINAVMESDIGKSVRHMVSAAVDSIPALLKVLDQVAEIHPFIKLAVGAFRVAVSLDLRRRDNDKKIPLVFAEMRDMMAVLVQLQTIDGHKRSGEDNATISGRMQHLIDTTEQNIRKCANSCNTYATRRFLSKVVHSASWSEEFESHIKTFKSRRSDFEFALAIHTSHAINTVNEMVFNVVEKVDRVLQYLDACRSPEEREEIEVVRAGGGAKGVVEDEKKLRELFRTRGDGVSVSSGPEHRVGGTVDEVRFRELRKELQMDVQTAIRENLEQFQAKFIIQQRQLAEGLRQAMRSESDRVINMFVSGPQDKIRDEDINQIWNEMRWRGSVKGRHFVLALRDHFCEKRDQLKNTKDKATPTDPTDSQLTGDHGEWALDYIHITRVQPIMEAFDNDASGFITVAEVNAFTDACPKNWSLSQWLAYWAVGHQISMSNYARKIDVLLARMIGIKHRVIPANRDLIDQYMGVVWTLVTKCTAAFRRVYVDERILHHFEAYTNAEEERISMNLMEANFNINAQDSIELICGPGRIEAHLFPLLYLLLKHDLEIMKVARTYYLHARELLDSREAILRVFGTVTERHRYLEDLFKQQKLDPDQQFKIFAFEIFKYVHNANEFWSMQKLRKFAFPPPSYDDSDSEEDQEVNIFPGAACITRYPLQTTEEYFLPQSFVETEADSQADPVIRKILGHWSGFFGKEDLYPLHEMLSLNLHVSPASDKEFCGSGIASDGTAWNLNGRYAVSEDGVVRYTFSINYSRYLARCPPQCFSGTLDESGVTFSGSWGTWYLDDEPGFTFVFKRLPPEMMCFYPTPTELAENKPRALWRFALSVIKARVCQNTGSWQWFRERWAIAKRYAELIGDGEDLASLSRDEAIELAKCMRALTTNEARFYFILQHFRRRAVHWDALCDACGRFIRGARVVCLSCGIGAWVDLCEDEACLASEVGVDHRHDLHSPHLPSHDVFKMRTAMHFHDIGEMYGSALSALKLARQLFAGLASGTSQRSQVNAVGPQLPTCIKCCESASLPCWYCIECPGHIVVCVSCDAEHGGISLGDHKVTHALVRCLPTPSDVELERATQLNTRIEALEAKLADIHRLMEDSFMGVDTAQSRHSARVGSLDERMQVIEDSLPLYGQQLSLRTGDEPSLQVLSLVTPGVAAESEFSAWVRQLRSTM